MCRIIVSGAKEVVLPRFLWAATLLLGLPMTPVGRAQPAQLALRSQIVYPQVIQGGVESVQAFIYNNAPLGASAGDYRVTAAYGQGLANSFGIMYTGTRSANGGTVPTGPANFNLNTTSIAPGTVPVAVTLQDRGSGGSVTQAGQFTVLAHAAPSLVLGGPPLSLSSRNVVKFQTRVVAHVFGEASPAGTEAAGGGFRPEMLGDPPGIPTAPLDLDSFTSFGSPNISTTLSSEANLPSTDTPGTGQTFNIFVVAPDNLPYDTTFDTTFIVHYSDSDDLPGANAPGSQLAAFNVNVEIEGDTANWTVTTGIELPDRSSTGVLLAAAAGCCIALHHPSVRLRSKSRLVATQP